MVACVLLMGVLMPRGAVAEQEMPPVNVIEIDGLRRISGDVVRNRISHPLGVRLSPEVVSDDIRAIYDLGYFKDVRAEVEPFEGGIMLVYVVKEKPIIRGVAFFGNKKVESESLQHQLTVSPGSVADTFIIQNNADRLRDYYEERGYSLASVVPVIREIDEGHVLVTYQIKEGRKVKINAIKIPGAVQVSEKTVKKAMKSKKWSLLRIITLQGYYEKSTLAEDRMRIRDLYHDKGFIKAVVAEPEVEYAGDRKSVAVKVGVSEGEQYRVSNLLITGNTLLDEQELRDEMKLRVGALVTRKDLDLDIRMITDRFTEKGYAMATVYPDIIPDKDPNTMVVDFRINMGQQYRIGRINISGNVKTRDKVIRRELLLNEGDLFNSKLFRRSYQKINNLNFFEKVILKPVPNVDAATMDIEIDLEERSTGVFNIGMGYSSVERFVGMADVTLANLQGGGQYLKMKTEFSASKTLYEISYREPWLFDRPVSFNASIFDIETDYNDYDKRAEGFSLGLGRRFRDYWNANLTYRYEKATVFNIDEDASVLVRDQEGTRVTSSITPSLVRDSRDNLLDPHMGSRNSVSYTYAGIGGDNKFMKLNIDSSWYIPVTEQTTFMVRGRFNMGEGLDGQDLPLYERYRAGGGRTLRGLRDVGPVDDTGEYIGGTRRILFNLEYIFPIYKAARINGVLFYDIGSTYDASPDMRDSIGAGIKWISPVGPIEMDWARVLDPKKNEATSRWEFVLGAFF